VRGAPGCCTDGRLVRVSHVQLGATCMGKSRPRDPGPRRVCQDASGTVSGWHRTGDGRHPWSPVVSTGTLSSGLGPGLVSWALEWAVQSRGRWASMGDSNPEPGDGGGEQPAAQEPTTEAL
jgi:hypothetical protein